MDISFHCDTARNFKDAHHPIRAFLYRDYSIEPHNHDFYEINVVFGGNGIHQIENTRMEVQAGDVFVIPPNVVHAYYNTRELDVYHILLQKSFMTEQQIESVGVPGFLQLTEIEPFLRQNFCETMFLRLSHGHLQTLKTELAFVEDGGEFDTDDLLPLKKHAVLKLLYWLSSLLHRQLNKDGQKHFGSHEQAIMDALEYIHQHYGEKITIERLCKNSYLSRSTFLRQFGQICGCTPTAYLKEYRCKKCLEMIETTALSKTEIAYACGFYDLSHMERTLAGQQASL